jgi:hypothetical protein
MKMVIQSLECLLLNIEYKRILTTLFYSAHIKLIQFTDMNVSALELCEHFCKRVLHRLSNKLMFQAFIRCNFTPV